MPTSDTRRLFFALWPGPDVSARLATAARQALALCGGRVMRRETLHLTLVFIGDVAESGVEILRLAASRVSGEAFALSLDRLGCWRHNGIVWAGCAASPPLIGLVGQLAGNLSGSGVQLETRDFAGHLTLLRNARCADLPAFEAIEWPVAEFVLVESRRSAAVAGYDIIGRWPLAPVAPEVSKAPIAPPERS